MARLSRRSLIKKAGAISALGAMASMVPLISGCHCEEPQITLNVVLHGLFVLDFQDSCIELLTPIVHDHVYRAGNWDKSAVFDLGKKRTYRLRGTDPIAVAPPVDPGNVVLTHANKDFDVDSDPSYFVIQLPFPSAIHSLRYICDPPSCLSTDPLTIDVYTLFLCQALVYPVSNCHELALVNSSWRPQVDSGTGCANLHFWAEPEKRLSPQHAYKAYQKLNDLLPPLIMQLDTDKVPPLDADTGVRGLPSEEEQGWAEWQNGGEGSAPTNCRAVMANATTKPKQQRKEKKMEAPSPCSDETYPKR
jgi:hypothetical protein